MVVFQAKGIFPEGEVLNSLEGKSLDKSLEQSQLVKNAAQLKKLKEAVKFWKSKYLSIADEIFEFTEIVQSGDGASPEPIMKHVEWLKTGSMVAA